MSQPEGVMTIQDLQEFIDRNRIQATIMPMDEHTLTVSDAARVLGVDKGQIIKSLIFLAPAEPLLVIANGTARIDRRKLSSGLGVNRKHLHFADSRQALEVTGYAVGSMPPFGHRRKLRTIIDQTVLRLAVVYGGGGAINAMLRLTPAELLRVTGAELMDLAESR